MQTTGYLQFLGSLLSLLLTLLENPGKGTASPMSAGVNGDSLLGSSADPSGIVL